MAANIFSPFFIFSCLYFFLPIYAANMIPPLAANVSFLRKFDYPVDFGWEINGHRLLGSHKTWRGVICAVIAGVFVIFIQSWLEFNFSVFQKISLIDYKDFNLFFLGGLMSFGAMAGDLFAAFIKRRLGLRPGQAFIPWDQTNYVIGSFFFLQPYVHFNWNIWITLLIATFFLHVLVNRWGYILGIHQAKW